MICFSGTRKKEGIPPPHRRSEDRSVDMADTARIWALLSFGRVPFRVSVYFCVGGAFHQ